AVVSIETKSGTNSYHGGVFEFLRNKALNAASNYFDPQGTPVVDPLRRNQFGGYVGGPILKNKVFFFFNYQGTRLNSAAGSNRTQTPTAAMLNGDFSGISTPLCTGSGAPAGCPFATVNGKPNQVDPVLFNPAAVTIATTGLPLGQQPDGTVFYPGGATIQSFNEYTARVDFNVSNSQRVSLRSFVNRLIEPSGDVPGNILSVLNLNPWSQTFAERMEFYSEALSHTWEINPTTVNTASVFWTQMSAHNDAAVKDKSGQNMCWSRYINVNELPGQCYMEGFSVGGGGFNGGWTEPSQEVRTTYGLYDNLTKTVGKHIISAGVNLQHQFAEELTQYPTTPIVGFNGQYTGNGLADFLLGYMQSYTQGAGEIASVSGWQPGFYGQDQYRMRPNLSITAGLRWEPNLAPGVAGGRGAAYVPGQQSTLFANAPLGLVFPGDKGISKGLMPNTYGYWEPRVGVAWQPQPLPNTSFRAGFGLFTQPLQYSMYNHTGGHQSVQSNVWTVRRQQHAAFLERSMVPERGHKLSEPVSTVRSFQAAIGRAILATVHDSCRVRTEFPSRHHTELECLGRARIRADSGGAARLRGQRVLSSVGHHRPKSRRVCEHRCPQQSQLLPDPHELQQWHGQL
ncbi:MAG: hypothetical protein WAN65_29700, partial [Candidatus Sulfotelmatobacter sp.]